MGNRIWTWVVWGVVASGCGGDDGAGRTTTLTTVSATAATATGEATGNGPGGTASGADTEAATSVGSDGSAGADTSGGATGATSGADTGDPGYDGEPGDFTSSFDGRDYRMYVPSGYTHDAAIPIVVGFHGAGDTGANFYAIAEAVGLPAAAEPAAYILVVPDTKSPFSDWANWSGNPNNDIDAMIGEMDEVLALLDDVGTHYHLDDAQRHAFGFSNGGLFTGIGGMARADRFATLAVLGYGWGSFYLPPAAPVRQIPVQFGCGDGDGFYGGAQQSESFLASSGHDTRLVTAPGVGHSFSGIMGALAPADMTGWMLARPLP